MSLQQLSILLHGQYVLWRNFYMRNFRLYFAWLSLLKRGHHLPQLLCSDPGGFEHSSIQSRARCKQGLLVHSLIGWQQHSSLRDPGIHIHDAVCDSAIASWSCPCSLHGRNFGHNRSFPNDYLLMAYSKHELQHPKLCSVFQGRASICEQILTYWAWADIFTRNSGNSIILLSQITTCTLSY